MEALSRTGHGTTWFVSYAFPRVHESKAFSVLERDGDFIFIDLEMVVKTTGMRHMLETYAYSFGAKQVFKLSSE